MNWKEHVYEVPVGRFSFDVAGFGLNATDKLLFVKKYPDLGGKVEVEEQMTTYGGQVATAMIACKKLGLGRVRYMGKVGDDRNGEEQLSSIRQSGVDCSNVRIEKDAPSQWATIVVDMETGERTIFWNRSDKLDFREDEISVMDAVQAPILLLDGHDQNASVLMAQYARQYSILIVLDMDKVRMRTGELISLSDFCIGSETFARDFTGINDLASALAGLVKAGTKFAAATLGAKGASFLWENQLITVPGFKVDCKDTTGAGDVFHGAFVYGLSKKWPLGKIIEFSNASSALNCAEYGARGGLKTEEEVFRFISCYRLK